MVHLLALALSLLAADSPATASPPAAPTPERLAANSSRRTPAGVTFTVPAGWTISHYPAMVMLAPPEADSHLALVDAQAKDADAAVAAAWTAYRPDSKRPLKLAVPQAAEDGWEERRIYEYETSPNERMVVYAGARRAGAAWVVAIVDATEPTFEKRLASIRLVLQSLRPKGYQRESFAGKKAHALDAKRVAVMKGFVESAMKQLGIPGAAFSLLDGGKVVFQGGLGVKELGKPDAVDADTLFLAASNTKALTTLLLAELVDEKRIHWDQPVTEVHPGFRLGDAETTRQVLVRHLLCACTGLPRQDMEWLFEYRHATPASSLALLATVQPTSRFGEVFQYSNLMATAAGYVAASVLYPGREVGAAYDEAMRAKVFRPLGMNDTTFDFARARKGDWARPHGDGVDGKPSAARMDLNYSVVPVRPAGGVWTTVRDLSRYVQLELARGRLPGGKQLVSEANLLERRKPQIPVSEDVTYGMGLQVTTTWGVPVVHHGGSLFGYKSDMIWLPDHGVGAVILTNSDAGVRLLAPFRRRLVEILFDGKPHAEEQVRVAALQKDAAIAKARERLAIPPSREGVGKLAARYTSPALGELAVRTQGGATVFDVGEWRSAVASRTNDDETTSFITIDPTMFDRFDFVVAERDGRRALVLRDAQHEYVFKEAAP